MVTSHGIVDTQRTYHKPILKKFANQTHNPSKTNAAQTSGPPPVRSIKDLHWICWDHGPIEPPGLQKRLHKPWPSPEPPRDAPIEDRMFRASYPEPQQTPHRHAVFTPSFPPASPAASAPRAQTTQFITQSTKQDKYNSTSTSSQFVPNFRSWHSNPTDYEKAVTYNMLQHMNGKKAEQLDRMRRNARGRYEHPINFERRIIRDTYRALSSIDNSSQVATLQRAPIDYYPVSYHRPRYGSTDPFVNTSSHFAFTQPAHKASYIIHPQFVSENSGHQKNIKHLTAAKGNEGLRYGSRGSGV